MEILETTILNTSLSEGFTAAARLVQDLEDEGHFVASTHLYTVIDDIFIVIAYRKALS